MKANAVVRLRLPSEKHLEIVLRTLEPEVGRPATTRSKANLEREGTFLVLKVKAKDTVALRTALNTYLRWMNLILDVLKILQT